MCTLSIPVICCLDNILYMVALLTGMLLKRKHGIYTFLNGSTHAVRVAVAIHIPDYNYEEG